MDSSWRHTEKEGPVVTSSIREILIKLRKKGSTMRVVKHQNRGPERLCNLQVPRCLRGSGQADLFYLYLSRGLD